MIIECSFTVLERRGDSRLIKHVHKWRIVSLYPLYRVVDTAYCPRARGGVYSAHLKSKGSHANTIHPPISEGISERVLISPNFLSRPFPGWKGVGYGTLCHNHRDTSEITLLKTTSLGIHLKIKNDFKKPLYVVLLLF